MYGTMDGLNRKVRCNCVRKQVSKSNLGAELLAGTASTVGQRYMFVYMHIYFCYNF